MNGNVLTTTDARGVTITNTYDRANRVKTRTYAGEAAGQQTPPVYFTYDGIYYRHDGYRLQATGRAKGSLTQVRNGISTAQTTEYDDFGRAKTYQQITDGQTYTSKYAYNFAGALVEEEYPSTRKVRHDFNPDGDLSKIVSKANTNATERTYASHFAYTSDGKIAKLKLGNNLWEAAKFNNRLQITELGLGIGAENLNKWKVNYDYGELQNGGTVDASKNTGNIAKQTISFAGLAQPFVQTYKYDSLYRLKEAKETSGGNQNWTQGFTYDRFGNRIGFSQNIGGAQNNSTPSIDAVTNRFNLNQGFGYDKNGNITSDVFGSQARQFTFNGENKQTEIRDPNIGTSPQNPDANLIGRYLYDGEGKRVKKVTATETTVFVYSGGKLIAEYSTKLAEQPSTNYTTTDHLGSPRIITNERGEVKGRRDFMPFGKELLSGVGNRTGDAGQKYASSKDEVRQKFTGYQKDGETGLDFAEARMYNNSHGRFTAVDPLLASGKSANPQTFNRYVYVMNSPLALTDPSGLCPPQTGCPEYRGPVFSGNGRTSTAQEEGLTEIEVGTNYVTTDPGDGRRYRVYNFGNGDSGWYRIESNDTVRVFLGGFSAAAYDAPEGAAKGSGNALIDLYNFATEIGLTLQGRGTYAPFVSNNPLAAERYSYDSPTEAKFGNGFQFGLTAAPAVIAPVFAGGSSALSVVPNGSSFSTSSAISTMESAYSAGGWQVRNIAGYEVGGNFGRVGNTYNANIWGMYRTGNNRSMFSFIRTLESEAAASGANSISITGTHIRNPTFFNPSNAGRANRLGFEFRQVNSETIILTKTLP